MSCSMSKKTLLKKKILVILKSKNHFQLNKFVQQSKQHNNKTKQKKNKQLFLSSCIMLMPNSTINIIHVYFYKILSDASIKHQFKKCKNKK